jgi:hypothetical protein
MSTTVTIATNKAQLVYATAAIWTLSAFALTYFIGSGYTVSGSIVLIALTAGAARVMKMCGVKVNQTKKSDVD